MVADRHCPLPRPVAPAPTCAPITPAKQRVLSYACAGYSNHPSPSLRTTGKEIVLFLGKAEPTAEH